MLDRIPDCKCGSPPDTWKFDYDAGEAQATFTCPLCGEKYSIDCISIAFTVPRNAKRVSCDKECPNLIEKQRDETRIMIVDDGYYIVTRNGISEHVHSKFDCSVCDKIKPCNRAPVEKNPVSKQLKVI